MDDITNVTNFTNVTNKNGITSATPASQLVFAVWDNICRLAKKHLAKQLRNTWEISGKVLPFSPKFWPLFLTVCSQVPKLPFGKGMENCLENLMGQLQLIR